MKKTTLKLMCFTVCALILTACKHSQTLDTTVSSTTSTTKSPHSAGRSSNGYTREAMMLEGSGRMDCSNPGSNCKVSADVIDSEGQQISIVQAIIAQTGNGNGYFNSNYNWQILFEEVNDTQGLLSAIQSNNISLYEIPSVQGSGTTYGYSYVLSTASNVSSVNANNIISVWQY